VWVVCGRDMQGDLVGMTVLCMNACVVPPEGADVLWCVKVATGQLAWLTAQAVVHHSRLVDFLVRDLVCTAECIGCGSGGLPLLPAASHP
jgi:hypothetical protein